MSLVTGVLFILSVLFSIRDIEGLTAYVYVVSLPPSVSMPPSALPTDASRPQFPFPRHPLRSYGLEGWFRRHPLLPLGSDSLVSDHFHPRHLWSGHLGVCAGRWTSLLKVLLARLAALQCPCSRSRRLRHHPVSHGSSLHRKLPLCATGHPPCISLDADPLFPSLAGQFGALQLPPPARHRPPEHVLRPPDCAHALQRTSFRPAGETVFLPRTRPRSHRQRRCSLV
jgi:hypothetical protein